MCKSHKGFEYFVTWVDDKSHKVFINRLRAKSEVFEHFKVFIAQAELETGNQALMLCSDRGGEYTSNNMELYL